MSRRHPATPLPTSILFHSVFVVISCLLGCMWGVTCRIQACQWHEMTCQWHEMTTARRRAHLGCRVSAYRKYIFCRFVFTKVNSKLVMRETSIDNLLSARAFESPAHSHTTATNCVWVRWTFQTFKGQIHDLSLATNPVHYFCMLLPYSGNGNATPASWS